MGCIKSICQGKKNRHLDNNENYCVFSPKLSPGRWGTGLEYTKAQDKLPRGVSKETLPHIVPGRQVVLNKWSLGRMKPNSNAPGNKVVWCLFHAKRCSMDCHFSEGRPGLREVS